jgi:hypothetical protein
MSATRWDRATYLADGWGRSYAWIDFVDSDYLDGLGESTDYLVDSRWRSTFLEVAGLPELGTPFPKETFRALRANLRIAAEHIAAGRRIPGKLIAALNGTLARPVSRSIVKTNSGYEIALDPAREDWSWVAAQIVATFGAFLESGQLERLKICPNPDCKWVFFDQTKANTRRWCNDKRCGNRDKVRRHREKYAKSVN